MANVYQAGGKAVGKIAQTASRDAKEVAALVKDKFNLTEPVGMIADAIKKWTSSDPEAANAFAKNKKNPNKIIADEGFDIKGLRQNLQQPSRAGQQPDITDAPFEPAVNLSRTAPVSSPVPASGTISERIQASRRVDEEPSMQERAYAAWAEGSQEPEFDDVGGLQGLVSREPLTISGMGGMPAPKKNNLPTLNTARKVGAGLVAAGALGKALPERGEKEDNKLPVYNVSPRITADGELAPTDAEYQSALRSGADGVTKLMSTYDDLNEQLNKQPLVAYRSGANTKVQRAEQFLSSLEAMRPKPAKELAGPPVEGKTVPAKTEEREQAIEPAPVPVGGETKPSKGVSSNDAKVQSAVSQVKAGTVLQNDITSIEDKLKAGKAITRGDLFALTEKIDSIRPEEVKADAALVAELKSAREMARKAYQEQASRNEWAEVAQTLGNAVANFIAAQRGVADRALALPQVDYNARTQQALREYQTELGSVAEQEKALERGTERRERTAEKTAEEKRRAWERLLGIGEKQIEAQERQAAQDKNLSLQLQIAGAKEARAVNAAEKRAAIAEQKAQQQGDKQYVSALGKDIAQTNQQIEDFQRRLATATNVANSSTKDFDDNFNKYAALLGVTKEEAAFQKKGFFGGSSFDREAARKEAIADVLRLKEQVATLRQKKAQKEQEQQAVLTGGQQASQPATRPAGQQPAAGGKVLSKADLDAYAKSQNTTSDAARAFLTSQGYTILDK